MVTRMASHDALAQQHTLPVRSIDTMKFSRDVARAKLNDKSYDSAINEYVRQIADTGATHIGIATPYDDEFLPFLKRWVAAARRHKLKVWFRGNFSGWEGWFDYPEMSNATHIRKTEAFILKNKDLFVDGDIFTSCPECENGDNAEPYENPRTYRAFLISEYKVTKAAFVKIKKKVTANYYSMNGDVAKLIMDKETTKALDGVITIDHYVETPDELAEDIKEYAEQSGGKVVLGEIGVPIPDIHGEMTQKEQAEWMAITFHKVSQMPEVVGINYWVSAGGSTALWDEKGDPKEIATVVKNFYSNRRVEGTIKNELDAPIAGAQVKTFTTTITTDKHGKFTFPYLYKGQRIHISAIGYNAIARNLEEDDEKITLVLPASNKKDPEKSIFQKIIDTILSPFQ